MGIKISKVRDYRTLREITTSDCENGYSSEYTCISDGCNAQMSFVPTHERRVHEKTIIINSFFKLKKNEQHTYGKCPYNTLGSVEIIARDSDPNIFNALDNQKYEFSLQILQQPNSSAEIKEQNSSTKDSQGEISKGKQYTKSGTASGYIKTLTQILQLRARLEEDKELASILTLKYQGKKIKWSNFYFEEDHYLEASKIIANAKKAYPVCFHGTIGRLIPQTKRFQFCKIKLNSPYTEPINKINDIPSIELILSNKQIKLENFAIGQEILVYGIVTRIHEKIWMPPKTNENTKVSTFKFINMDIWVNQIGQLIIL